MSCDLCSGIFLEKLISDGLLPRDLHDLLNTTMGRAAFRICLLHAQEECAKWTASFRAANEVMLNEISEWHKGAIEQPDDVLEMSSFLDNELRCLTFLNKINGADRSLFKRSLRIQELGAAFPDMSFGRKMLDVNKFEKVIAVRPAFTEQEATQQDLPTKALAWRQYMKKLCDVYKRSFKTTELSISDWDDVVSLNEKLLKVVGFCREGQPTPGQPTPGQTSGTFAMSFRRHKEESSFCHFDHPAFCFDYLLGLVLRGRYRLAHILNIIDVMQGAEPKFDWVHLREGDVYCMTGPQLRQQPHLPIPEKGETNIERDVVLIGGVFVYGADSEIGRFFCQRHEELMQEVPLVYHFRPKDRDPANALVNFVPENAIKGVDVARDIDKLISDEVNSSLTNYPFSTNYYCYRNYYTQLLLIHKTSTITTSTFKRAKSASSTAKEEETSGKAKQKKLKKEAPEKREKVQLLQLL